jgi:hypothetical protein
VSLLKRVKEYLTSDSGNVESALVMIPLIALFLITLQLIATVNYRNLDMTIAQNVAAKRAIELSPNSDDQIINLDSQDRYSKLRLLIVKAERVIPRIFPGVDSLLGGRKLRSIGSSVIEEEPECSGGYLIC